MNMQRIIWAMMACLIALAMSIPVSANVLAENKSLEVGHLETIPTLNLAQLNDTKLVSLGITDLYGTTLQLSDKLNAVPWNQAVDLKGVKLADCVLSVDGIRSPLNYLALGGSLGVEVLSDTSLGSLTLQQVILDRRAVLDNLGLEIL